MKFVFVATTELKEAPLALKISYAILAVLSLTVLFDLFSQGLIYGAFNNGLGWGSGITAALVAFIIFDVGNTIVRKRKTARFIALVIGVAAIALGILNYLSSSDVLSLIALIPAVLGLALILLLNLKSANQFFSPSK